MLSEVFKKKNGKLTSPFEFMLKDNTKYRNMEIILSCYSTADLLIFQCLLVLYINDKGHATCSFINKEKLFVISMLS